VEIPKQENCNQLQLSIEANWRWRQQSKDELCYCYSVEHWKHNMPWR